MGSFEKCMTKKERIEDLGKLSAMLKDIGQDLFYEVERYWRRPKDAADCFFQMDESKQYDAIHSIAYGLQDLSEKLSECWCIANGDEE